MFKINEIGFFIREGFWKKMYPIKGEFQISLSSKEKKNRLK